MKLLAVPSEKTDQTIFNLSQEVERLKAAMTEALERIRKGHADDAEIKLFHALTMQPMGTPIGPLFRNRFQGVFVDGYQEPFAMFESRPDAEAFATIKNVYGYTKSVKPIMVYYNLAQETGGGSNGGQIPGRI
jgi:hypothetical protein